jgi:SAM-dependent methyltransferase
MRLFKPEAPALRFEHSSQYWEERYRQGGTSGEGSYGPFAEFKAEVLNDFVRENQVRSVVEFGCGDGNQMSLFQFPAYTGVDVSSTVIERLRQRFAGDATRRFFTTAEVDSIGTHELSMSLDVIYHLVEDPIYDAYMRSLFGAASRFVAIYASNGEPAAGYNGAPHVRHRRFTEWIEQNAPQWKLLRRIPNRYPYQRIGDEEKGSFADFYFFQKSA